MEVDILFSYRLAQVLRKLEGGGGPQPGSIVPGQPFQPGQPGQPPMAGLQPQAPNQLPQPTADPLDGPVQEQTPVANHYGPGPHRTGSPQKVHGKQGAAEWAAQNLAKYGTKSPKTRQAVKEALKPHQNDPQSLLKEVLAVEGESPPPKESAEEKPAPEKKPTPEEKPNKDLTPEEKKQLAEEDYEEYADEYEEENYIEEEEAAKEQELAQTQPTEPPKPAEPPTPPAEPPKPTPAEKPNKDLTPEEKQKLAEEDYEEYYDPDEDEYLSLEDIQDLKEAKKAKKAKAKGGLDDIDYSEYDPEEQNIPPLTESRKDLQFDGDVTAYNAIKDAEEQWTERWSDWTERLEENTHPVKANVDEGVMEWLGEKSTGPETEINRIALLDEMSSAVEDEELADSLRFQFEEEFDRFKRQVRFEGVEPNSEDHDMMVEDLLRDTQDWQANTAWSHEHLEEDVIPKLTAPEYEAIKYYTGSGYVGLNEYLREGKTLDPTEQRIVENLKSVIAKAPPLPEGTRVLRGLGTTRGEATKLIEQLVQARDTKAPMGFSQFVSTTLNPAVVDHFTLDGPEDTAKIVFHIDAKRGVFLGRRLGHAQGTEQEILQSPDTRYRVVSVTHKDWDGDGTIVHLEEIGDDE